MTKDITVRRAIKWISSGQTDVGTVRNINEDSILEKPELGLWVVADGMGGYDAGEIASSMIVDALEEITYLESLDESVDLIENNLIDVNHKILEYCKNSLDQKMMGSTVVSLIIRGRNGACLWAGDSRLYRYRNDELRQISRDHSHVEELIQQGLLKEEEAQNHPESNVITRAVGAQDVINIEVNTFDIQIGDVFLLCSDGLYNSVNSNDITFCLRTGDVNEGAKNLLKKSLENNASDNVSLIIARGEVEKSNATENNSESITL